MFNEIRSALMVIIVSGFFMLLFGIVISEMILSVIEKTQPSVHLWSLLEKVLIAITGIISGFIVGGSTKKECRCK
tara:strand:- start:212 stop:436 length:225 start_codon:yes stop_codon:yes gene_type:complete